MKLTSSVRSISLGSGSSKSVKGCGKADLYVFKFMPLTYCKYDRSKAVTMRCVVVGGLVFEVLCVHGCVSCFFFICFDFVDDMITIFRRAALPLISCGTDLLFLLLCFLSKSWLYMLNILAIFSSGTLVVRFIFFCFLSISSVKLFLTSPVAKGCSLVFAGLLNAFILKRCF